MSTRPRIATADQIKQPSAYNFRYETLIISDFQSYMESGWQWTSTITDDVCGGDDAVTDYRTNGCGQGLWICKNGEEQQLLGTCQFSLPIHAGRAKMAIREWTKRMKNLQNA